MWSAPRCMATELLADDPKHSSYDAYWRELGTTAGGPLGIVLPQLEPLLPPLKGRDEAKTPIVEAARRFLTGPTTALVLAPPRSECARKKGARRVTKMSRCPVSIRP